ncbi:MAG: hypothetical protein ACYTHM_06830 [Planctomycetota bacterium]|jgi:hypothetical protein
MDFPAIESLIARFERGDLSCTGPKHFPPSAWSGPEGLAMKIGAELGPEARRGIEEFIDTLRHIRTAHPDFSLEAAGDAFLDLLEKVRKDTSLPPRFRHLLSHFLVKDPGVARPRKGPQVDNTIAFLEAVKNGMAS